MIQSLILEKTFPAPGTHLWGMAWDGQYLRHSDASTNLIYEIDSTNGKILAEIHCPEVRTDLAFDGKNFWQIAGQPKRIVVVDPRRGICFW